MYSDIYDVIYKVSDSLAGDNTMPYGTRNPLILGCDRHPTT